MNEQKKLYPERDPTEFVDYYMRHVDAMTSEELFGKGDIAVQLAWRDREIDQLRQRLAEVEAQNNILRGADYHQAGIQQEKEIIALEAKLALAEQDAMLGEAFRWARDNARGIISSSEVLISLVEKRANDSIAYQVGLNHHAVNRRV